MAKDYDCHVHTHITLNSTAPKTLDPAMWNNVWGIVLHTGKYVWIGGGYQMLDQDEMIKQVGDGRDKGFDEHGGCIISIPAEWCHYHTPEDAEGIAHCFDADERLLSYAL